MRVRLVVMAASLMVLAATPAAVAATSDGGCGLPAYPTRACTGVPAGTTFARTVQGDYTATTAGETIHAWHITGTLIIRASGVVVTDTQIDGYVDNEATAASSVSIADSTVGTGQCATPGLPSIDGHDVTATRVLLQGHQDAVDVVGDNVTVSDSYLQPCYLPPSVVGGDGYHSDGVQDQCDGTCSGLILRHNTIDAQAFYGGEATGNSALNLGSAADGHHLRDVTLDHNMFLGGGYSTSLTWDAGAAWTVTGNVWVTGSWSFGPISAEGTCAHQQWSGNAIVDADADYRVVAVVEDTGCID